MTKVIILGTSNEFLIDNPNEVYIDETTGLCAFVSNKRLINVPTNRLMLVTDAVKDKKVVIQSKKEDIKEI